TTIDERLASPSVFAAIRSKIVTGRKERLKTPSVFGWNLKAGMAAAVLVAAFAILLASIDRQRRPLMTIQSTNLEALNVQPERRVDQPAPSAVETLAKARARKITRPERKAPTIRRQSITLSRIEPATTKHAEFYPLAAFDSQTAMNESRIVRVDLPRSSLLSLGVNIPLESEMATVKTDLLLGPDGVARAIRLVE
ncbi:MAG: hypothetical protein LC730_05315, partial [Acidobacteria bacterium]|nr:hypothetical protein [Acidobacteriota bacterium]